MPDILSPIDLKKNVPAPLVNQFWGDFLDTVSTELNNFKGETDKKAGYLDINSYTDSNELIELSKSFGYVPNLQLSNDLETVQRETSSIFYKIRNKAILNYYLYVFKLAKRLGKVFNGYQDYLKLIRAVDFVSMAVNLNAVRDYTLPFTGIEPNNNFTDYQSFIATLDAALLLFFDSSATWFFDNPNMILPTQNLLFEYDVDKLILDSNNNPYTMTPAYFRFLEQSILYGKKVTTLPHIGAFLNFISDEDIFYDTYDINGTGYSVPSLKLSSSVTPFYKPISLSPIFTLDSGHTFDQDISWLFDLDKITGLPENINLLFNQIVIGSGTKSLYSKNHPNVNFNLILYYPFDEEYGTTILDDSTNGINGTASGNFVRQQGIVGRDILFDGTSAKVQTSLSLSNSNKTFAFWINPSITQNYSKAKVLFQSNYLDINYDLHSVALNITIKGTLGSTTLSVNVLAGINSQVVLELDTINHLAMVYVNGNLVDLINISGLGTIQGTGNFFIGTDGTSNYFKGQIDELRIYSSLLSAADILYMYQQQIGSLRSLAHRLWTGPISFNELYEDSKWKSVNSWAPGLTKNQEFLSSSNGALTSISGNLEIAPTAPGYLIINYTGNAASINTIDDGLGNIFAPAAQGTINYATGAYTLNFHRDYQVLNFQIPFISHSFVDYFILNLPVLPGTLSLQYTIASTVYKATDNGAGVVTGTGISSGTINYATGELVIHFSSPIDTSSVIFLSYTYRLTQLPDNNTLIFATYKLAKIVNVTEMGILNTAGQMVAYSTFPPMQFDSIRNHIGGAFHIIKP